MKPTERDELLIELKESFGRVDERTRNIWRSVEKIEKHEKWEAKPKKKTNRKKRKANSEQIIKWLDMI